MLSRYFVQYRRFYLPVGRLSWLGFRPFLFIGFLSLNNQIVLEFQCLRKGNLAEWQHFLSSLWAAVQFLTRNTTWHQWFSCPKKIIKATTATTEKCCRQGAWPWNSRSSINVCVQNGNICCCRFVNTKCKCHTLVSTLAFIPMHCFPNFFFFLR